MSYLHCPTCKRAYNFEVRSVCPYCPVAATVVDATEDIVVAAEQLARAMERATAAERGAAAARMDRLALPAPGDASAPQRAPVLRQIRYVLEPPPPPAAKPPLLATIAMAVDRRLAAIEALWPRSLPLFRALAPRSVEAAPPAGLARLGDGLRRVRARVRAIAQAA